MVATLEVTKGDLNMKASTNHLNLKLMKNIAIIFSILLMGFSANANPTENRNDLRRGYDGNAFIFVEGDVEFSVFPDGQFDFVYIGPQKTSRITVNSPNVNISFNSGYNYDAYVQYDDYGAVIQIENVPVYYDAYGRIIQAGNVDISYNDRRLVRVGGLHIIYNNYGYYSHHTGYINMYNPYYVYRPWHVYYARPLYTHCVVYDMPYRRYYTPVRYGYHQHIVYYNNRHKVAYNNGRRDFYRPGSYVYDEKGRGRVNKDFDPNRRNTMVTSNVDRNNNTGRTDATRNNSNIKRNSDASNRTQETNKTRGNSSSTINNNPRANQVSTRNENTLRTNSAENSNTRTNSAVNNTRRQTVDRSTPVRNISNNGTRNTQQINTKAPSNRNSSVNRTPSQPIKREKATRSTINNTTAPARGNSNVNTSRNSSSRESSSRNRG